MFSHISGRWALLGITNLQHTVGASQVDRRGTAPDQSALPSIDFFKHGDREQVPLMTEQLSQIYAFAPGRSILHSSSHVEQAFTKMGNTKVFDAFALDTSGFPLAFPWSLAVPACKRRNQGLHRNHLTALISTLLSQHMPAQSTHPLWHWSFSAHGAS